MPYGADGRPRRGHIEHSPASLASCAAAGIHGDLAVTLPAQMTAHALALEAPARIGSTQSFLTVQALRAVAALLVVVYHAFDMWQARIGSGTPDLSWSNGAAGVDIFFVISGFVMVVSSQRLLSQPRGWLTFMRYRVVRIVPLYWLLTTVKLALVLLFADLALRSSHDLDYVMRSYAFFPMLDSAGHFRPLLPVGWTLTYEFLFYLLFALAMCLRVGTMSVLVPAFVVFVGLALLRTDTWPAWTILFSTIVVEFLFGVALAQATLRGWALPAASAGAAMLLGFVLILTVPEGGENLRTLTWGLPALLIVAGAVAMESRMRGKLPQWLLTLGDASYSIYLVHGFVLPAVGVALIALHWSTLGALTLTVTACLLVASLAGLLTYVFVERPMTVSLKKQIGG